MKKIWKTAVMLVCVLCLGVSVAALGACNDGDGGDDDVQGAYTITYDGNGGTVSKATDKANEGELIEKPNDPTRPHYTFDGWYHGENAWNFEEDTVAGDMTLTAHWDPITYRVQFYDHDGEELYLRSYTEETVNGFTMPEVPAAPAMHTNARWDKTREQILCYSETTFEVHAISDYDGFTVSFDTNGGTPEKINKQELQSGSKVSKPDDPEKEHYIFAGWYYNDTEWDFEVNTVEENMTLIAHWAATVYSIKFIGFNGEEIETKTYTCENIDGFVWPDPPAAPAHHENARWDKTKEECLVYSDEEITVTAIADIMGYDVTFDADNGTESTKQRVAYNGYATEPEEPEKAHYTFAGWYLVNDDGSEIEWIFEDDTVNGNITLKAHWTAIEYTIKFVDFDNQETTKTYTEENIAEFEWPEAPTAPEHKENARWDKTKDECLVYSDEVITVTAIADFKQYTVTFDGAGGSETQSATVVALTCVTKPADPTKDHYTFAGWYNGDTAWNFEVDTVEGNMTLTAHWTPKSYTVTFDSDGGTDVANETVVYNTTVTKPNDPEKEHYDFAGWYNGETAWNFEADKVQGAMTLTAHWTPKKYEVRLVNCDDEQTTLQVTYNTPVEYTPERKGFKFNGWHLNTLDGAEYVDAPVEGPMTLVASWKVIAGTGTKYTMSAEDVKNSITVDAMRTSKTVKTMASANKGGWYHDSDYNGDFVSLPEKVYNNYVEFGIDSAGHEIVFPAINFTLYKKVDFGYFFGNNTTLTLNGVDIPTSGNPHISIVSRYEGVYVVVRTVNGESAVNQDFKLPDEVANGEKGITLIASSSGWKGLGITEFHITPKEADYLSAMEQIVNQLSESKNSTELHLIEKYLAYERYMTDYEKIDYTRNAKITNWLSSAADTEFTISDNIMTQSRSMDAVFQKNSDTTKAGLFKLEGLSEYTVTVPAINYSMFKPGAQNIVVQMVAVVGASHKSDEKGGYSFKAYGATLVESDSATTWFLIRIVQEASELYLHIINADNGKGGKVKLPDAVAYGMEELEFTLMLQDTDSDTLKITDTSGQTSLIKGTVQSGL